MLRDAPLAWDDLTRVNVDLSVVMSRTIADVPPADAGESSDLAESDDQLLVVAPRETLGREGRQIAFDMLSRSRSISARAADYRIVDLRIAAELPGEDGHVLVVQQTLAGHDVYGALAKIHIADDVVTITGRPLGDLERYAPSVNPEITAFEAVNRARRVLGGAPQRATVRLLVFPLPDGGRWAYRVKLALRQPPADVHAFIDAGDGELLLSFNVAASSQGVAEVFPTSPGRTPSTTKVALKDLDGVPPGMLRGGQLLVERYRPPSITSINLDFSKKPDEAGFDEASAYYTLIRGMDYFGSLYRLDGLGSPPFRPVRSRVNVPGPYAVFRPDRNAILLGAFGPRSAARAADIVLHELGHVVTFAQARLGETPSNSQSRGLAEGYSDYFACSLLGDPRVGEWLLPSAARDISGTGSVFARGFRGEEHANGTVWAAVLWDLRTQLGPNLADRLVAQSTVVLTPYDGFLEAKAALRSAGRTIAKSGSAPSPWDADIERAFAKRAP